MFYSTNPSFLTTLHNRLLSLNLIKYNDYLKENMKINLILENIMKGQKTFRSRKLFEQLINDLMVEIAF